MATRLTNFTALNLVAYNGGVAFSPDSADNRDQIWVANGATSGLVKDLGTANNASLSYVTNLNGSLLFGGTDGSSVRRLWRSNGVIADAGGTVILNTQVEFPDTNIYGYATAVNGVLFFTGTTQATGTELWKSDGSSGGTVLVKDITTGSYQGYANSSYLYQLTPYGRNLLFFSQGSKGAELWRSDGSTAGTTRITTLINTSYSFPYPDQMTVVGSQVFFTSEANQLGSELWTTDGTRGGTVLVKDIYTGSTGGDPNGSLPTQLTGVGSMVFFLATDNASGSKDLWCSDGSSLGTKKISGGFSAADDLTAVGTSLFFAATSSSTGEREIWTVDTTSLIAREAANVNTKPGGSSNPTSLTKVGNQLFFAADDGSTGNELWSYNPKSGAIESQGDLNPNAASSNPSNLTVAGTTLYFNATQGSTPGLWSLPVTSLLGYYPPAFTGASVNGNTLILSLNQPVSGSGGNVNPSYFRVLVAGAAVAATAASLNGSGTALTLTLASSPASTAITDVIYSPPAGASAGTLIAQASGNTPMEPQTINNQTTASTFLSSSSVSGLAVTYTTLQLLGSATNGTGNTAANTIIGNSAANTLAGKQSNDLLTGGLATDRFVFDTSPDSLSNRDTITDFTPGTDKIVLSKSIFSGLGRSLNASQLLVYPGGVPTLTSATRLLFNTTNKVLSYDPDGVNGKAPVDVAVLTGVTNLSISDVLLG